jgi:hypothetical protein
MQPTPVPESPSSGALNRTMLASTRLCNNSTQRMLQVPVLGLVELAGSTYTLSGPVDLAGSTYTLSRLVDLAGSTYRLQLAPFKMHLSSPNSSRGHSTVGNIQDVVEYVSSSENAHSIVAQGQPDMLSVLWHNCRTASPPPISFRCIRSHHSPISCPTSS